MQTRTLMEGLLDRFSAIIGSERDRLVEMLVVLGEIDRLKIALEYGYTSIYLLLWKRFRIPESTARRRVACARVLARFPIAARYLASGQIDPGALVLLREVLEEATAADTLERAAGKTEDEIRLLVASMRRYCERSCRSGVLRPLERRMKGHRQPWRKRRWHRRSRSNRT